jgi:hypothetical protein
MGRVSEHLKGFHKSAMERCDTVSKCVGKLAGMAKASKSDMKDADEEGLCGTLQKISDAFADGASYHKSAMQECSKADVADELNKAATPEFEKRLRHLEDTIVPSRVSAITPNAPGVRAVLRHGAPELPARPNVPIQFEKLVAIEE